MKLSRFGTKFTADSGIVDLMDDLGEALKFNPDMLMLGGGTPARIEAAEAVYAAYLEGILQDPDSRYQLLGRYQGPLGDDPVRELLAERLSRRYGWAVTKDNIAVTNGGQSAFGILANMLAGTMADGSVRRVHFPLLPEYLGYTDAGFTEGFFSATPARLELLPERRFKYHVDFDTLALDDHIGALCVSRPTNPSGNVLTERELAHLDVLAREQGAPLIIDCAYGMPYPGLQFFDASAYWSDNTVLMLSLSKLGLPGLRSGFLVGAPDLIEGFSRANTIMNLASGNVGPMLAASLMADGELERVSSEILRPWYRNRAGAAEAALLQALEGLPCHLHVAEGAFFLWLWCENLPVGTRELYELLKRRGVLVIPGDTAFPGLVAPWQHSTECIRLSYALETEVFEQAAQIIGAELRVLYGA